MELQIISHTRQESGEYFEATCGKVTAYVWFSYSCDNITVCCQNASHRVWGKLGRTFRSVEEALAAYKSPQMKAIINAAWEA